MSVLHSLADTRELSATFHCMDNDKQDGSWVRYHPAAEPIRSHEALLTAAMTIRYNRARKLARRR